LWIGIRIKKIRIKIRVKIVIKITIRIREKREESKEIISLKAKKLEIEEVILESI
jgi:hypothetical protein